MSKVEPVRIGVDFFFADRTVTPGRLASRIEDLGFESLWVPDHPALPMDPSIVYSAGDGSVPEIYGEMLDPFVALSHAGAATTSLLLGTAVCLVAERHPLILGKTVASLDVLTGGRVLLGVGAGWLKQDLALYDIPFGERWPRVEEHVDILRLLWQQGEASFDGEFVRFPEIRSHPMPRRNSGPPIVIGAPPRESTFRRIARLGCDWLPTFISPECVRAGRAAIARECELIGRDPSDIEISVFVLDISPETQAAYAAAGADRLIVQLYNHPGTPVPRERWGDHQVAWRYGPPPAEGTTLEAVERLAKTAGLCA